MFLHSVVILCAAAAAHGFSQGPSDVVFHYFSRRNPTQSQPLLPNANIIASSMFERHIPTIITIHSYNESVSGNFNAHVVKAHLDAENVNVLAVDWSRGSFMYSFGLGNAPQTGDVIARFINILSSEFEYGPENIRIVGVGLGGHIAGIAARKVNGNIPHIVALDPSLVGWTHHPDKLKVTDANIVEVLYVTAGRYGYDKPLGDVNFYPNGGSQQVGCGTDIECSHVYGYAFYAESLTATAEQNHFVGTRCENYNQAMNMQCSGPRDVNFGGIAVKQGVSGIFTFVTNPLPPFARG